MLGSPDGVDCSLGACLVYVVTEEGSTLCGGVGNSAFRVLAQTVALQPFSLGLKMTESPTGAGHSALYLCYDLLYLSPGLTLLDCHQMKSASKLGGAKRAFPSEPASQN